ISFGQSDALNLTNFRFLAGSTETGLGGSASSATFQISHDDMQSQRLAVHPTGKIFVFDTRGLILIDAADGIQRLLVRADTTSTGDGGPASNASTRTPHRIALTYDGNILLSEYNRIRLIDMSASPISISTLIGGGALTADGSLATSLSITPTGF